MEGCLCWVLTVFVSRRRPVVVLAVALVMVRVSSLWISDYQLGVWVKVDFEVICGYLASCGAVWAVLLLLEFCPLVVIG